MRENTIVSLLFALALGLSLIGCEDTKARQENEQLKARVAELVKETGDLGNRVDALTQENAALKQENEQLKRKVKTKKTKKSKHHRSRSAGQIWQPNNQNPTGTFPGWLKTQREHA